MSSDSMPQEGRPKRDTSTKFGRGQANISKDGFGVTYAIPYALVLERKRMIRERNKAYAKAAQEMRAARQSPKTEETQNELLDV